MLAGALGLGLPLVWMSGCRGDDDQEAQAPVGVRVFEVGPESQRQVRTLSGRVQAVERTTLSFGVAGRLEELLAPLGTDVASGQRLATLDDQPYVLALESARGELATARAELDDVERMLGRMETAYASGAVSPSEYDDAVSAVAAAKGKATVASAGIAQAEFDLSRVALVAPYAGRVVEAPVERFQDVAASDAVVVLQSTDALQVEVLVPETMIRFVEVGQAVDVAFPQLRVEPLRCVITEVGAEASAGNAFQVTLALAPSSSDIRPGMTASATFSFATREQDGPVYLLPISVIATHLPGQPPGPEALPEGRDWVPVLVLDEPAGVIQRRDVLVGGLRGNSIEVFDGVAPDDLIIDAGVPLLREGMPARRWRPELGLDQ